MGDSNNRQPTVRINRMTSTDLSSVVSEPEGANGSIFDLLKSLDKLSVKQSHTADLARKRSRYDIIDQNGFPLLTGFHISRRFSVLPDPVRVYNTGLQNPLLEVKFNFLLAKYKLGEIYASNITIGSVKRAAEVDGFILFNHRDGYVFVAEKENGETALDIKFTVYAYESKMEVANITGKLHVVYTLALNRSEQNSSNTKALLLGFLLYYVTYQQ